MYAQSLIFSLTHPHILTSDIDNPITDEPQGVDSALRPIEQSSIDILISFGFSEETARRALRASVSNIFPLSLAYFLILFLFIFLNFQEGDIEKATDWIFNNPEVSSSNDVDASSSQPEAELPDGSGS